MEEWENVDSPFKIYELTFKLTRSELELLIFTIKQIIPSSKFHENLVMKIYDELSNKLKEIQDRD